MRHYVYLAGPITGITFDGAQEWRDYAASALDSDKVETLSPLRGKEFLCTAGILTNGTYDGALTTGKAINRRDFFDCTRASALLVNLSGAQRVSVGTVMEIAWAYQKQIPTIVVMEKGNLHHHVMLDECSTYIVETLEEGLAILKLLFNEPYTPTLASIKETA